MSLLPDRSKRSPYPVFLFSYEDLSVVELNEGARRRFFANGSSGNGTVEFLRTELFNRKLGETIDQYGMWVDELVLNEGGGERPWEITITPFARNDRCGFLAIFRPGWEEWTAPSERGEPRSDIGSTLGQLEEFVYMISIDPVSGDRKVEYMSPGMKRAFGLDAEEYLEWTESGAIYSFVHPSDRPEVKKTVQAVSEDLVQGHLLYRFYPRGSEKAIWLEEKILPRTDQQGRHVGNFGFARDVTEQKVAENRLIERELQFRELFSKASDAILLIDPDNNWFEDCNEKALELLGYKKDELLELVPGDVSPEYQPDGQKSDDSAKRWLQSVLNEERDQEGVYWKMRKKNGELIDVEAKVSTVEIKGKRLVQALIEDVTERMKYEAALKESEAKYRHLVETSHDLIWSLDTQGYIKFANHRPLWNIYGYEVREVIGKHFLDLADEEMRSSDEARFQEIFSSEYLSQYETIHRRKDGSRIWITVNASLVKDNEGYPVSVTGTISDVTERKKAEKALSESEKSYRDLFNKSADLIYIQDQDGTFLDVNEAVLQSYGYAKEEVLGKTPEIFSAPGRNNMEEVFRKIEKAWNGEQQTLDWWSIRKNGELFPKELVLRQGIYFGQDVIIATGRDISERVEALDALKRSERRFRSLMENSISAVYRVDMDGRIVDCNDAFARVFGYEKKEGVMNSHASDLYRANPQGGDPFVEQVKEAGRIYGYESRIELHDGTEKHLLENAVYVPTEEGGVDYIEGTLIDITERKRTEDLLQESEAKYRTLFRDSPLSMFIFDHDSAAFVDVNDKALETYGYSYAEFMELTLEDIRPQADISFLRKKLKEIERSGSEGSHIGELRHIKKDGTIFDVAVDQKPIQLHGQLLAIVSVRDITDVKRAERALRESRKRYKDLIETSPYGSIIHMNGTIVFMNTKAKEIAGLKEEDTQRDWRLYDFVLPEWHEQIEEDLKAVSRGGTIPFRELRIERSDGAIVDIEARATLGEFEGRSAIHIAFRDISSEKQLEKEQMRAELAEEANKRLEQEIEEHRKTQDKLLEARNFNRNIIDSSLDMIIATDTQDRLTELNQAAVHKFGYKKEELLGQPSNTLYRTKKEGDRIKRSIRENGRFSGEVVNITKDGAAFTSYLSAAVLKDKDGNVVGNMGISRDITKIKEAEEELRRSEERYRDLFENTTDLIQSVDMDGNFLYVNEAWKNALGYSEEEIGSLSLNDVIQEEEIPHCQAVFREVKEGKDQKNIQTVFVTRRGQELEVEGNTSVRLKNGKPVSTRSIFRDVTKQKQVERAIRESEAKYRAIYDQAYIGIGQVDLKGHFIQVNKQLTEILGFSEEELKEMTLGGLPLKDSRDLWKRIKNKLLNGKEDRLSLEESFLGKDEAVIFVNITVALVRNAREEPDYFVLVFDDISERKEAENQLQRSLEEKEILLKEVHHRVKNNLQVISSILNLQSSFSRDQATLDILKESQNRVRTMSFVHESLYRTKNFSSIELADYIKTLTQNLFHSYQIEPGKITLDLDIDESIYLNLDRAIPCGLIINELVSNALKYAFPEDRKGTVRIAMYRCQTTTPEKEGTGPGVAEEQEAGRSGSEKLALQIEDEGVGLPDQIRDGKKETLGLQLVESLCGQLDGSLGIHNKNGTKYLITFEKDQTQVS